MGVLDKAVGTSYTKIPIFLLHPSPFISSWGQIKINLEYGSSYSQVEKRING